MNNINLVCLSLTIFLMTHPLTTTARGVRGGGGHGRSRRARSHAHAQTEEGGHNNPPTNIPRTCSNTNDTNFCKQSLIDNPNSKGKDLRQLSLLALDMAKKEGVEICNAVSQRLQDDKAIMSVSVKNALNVFLDRYTETLGDLDKAIAALSTPANIIPFDDVKHWISGGMSNSEVCRVAILEAKPDDVDLQNEGKTNTEFYKLCDNALSVVTAFQFETWANNVQ